MFYILLLSFFVNYQTAVSQDIQNSVNKTFKNITSLDVEGSFCEVKIKGENRDDVAFNGEIISSKNYDIQIKYEVNGSTLKVWLKRPRSIRGKIKGKLYFKVPSNTNINVVNSSGGIDVENIGQSKVELIASSGSIHVRNIDTDISITSSSGSLYVKDVSGDVRLTSASGSINVSGINGDLYSVSSSGSQKIEGIKGNLKVTASSGSIILNMINGNINARTASGSILIDQANGNLTALSSSGGIKLDNISGALNLTSTSGSQRGSGIKITGDSSFKSSSGSVIMELLNDASELSFELYSSSGSLSAKGSRASHKLITGNGPIKIYGKTSSGSQNFK